MVCVRVCVFEHVLPWPQIFPCALSGPKSVQVNHNACTRRETRALIHAFGSFMHMIKGAHAGSVSAGTQARTDTYACALLDDHKHTEKHTQARTHAHACNRRWALDGACCRGGMDPVQAACSRGPVGADAASTCGLCAGHGWG